MKKVVFALLLLTACGPGSGGSTTTPFLEDYSAITLPQYFANHNRWVGDYSLSFDLGNGQTATMAMVAASDMGAKGGGKPVAGGILINSGDPSLPTKLPMVGSFQANAGRFIIEQRVVPKANPSASYLVQISGGLSLQANVNVDIQLKIGSRVVPGTLRRSIPAVTTDNKVLIINNLSADANVTAGSFPLDLFKTMWYLPNQYKKLELQASISNQAKLVRGVRISSEDIDYNLGLPSYPYLEIGRPIQVQVKNPTDITYTEWVPGIDLGRSWVGKQGVGRIVVDLRADLPETFTTTLHFEGIRMEPIASTGAKGEFDLSFSGTANAVDYDLNRPGRKTFVSY